MGCDDPIIPALSAFATATLEERVDDDADLRPALAASIRLAQRGPDAMRDAYELATKMRRAGLRVVHGGRL